MKVVILLIASAVLLICAIVLFILHFTIGIDIFWFSVPLCCSSIINLIAGIYNLHTRHKK